MSVKKTPVSNVKKSLGPFRTQNVNETGGGGSDIFEVLTCLRFPDKIVMTCDSKRDSTMPEL